MWKNFKEKMAAWIPEHISPKLIVGLYFLFDLLCTVRLKQRESNYNHNIELLRGEESPLGQGYIENQNDWANVFFGKTTMAFAGCEVLAVYNALLALGKDGGSDLIARLISDFERKGAAFQGWIGTSPLAIKKYLNKLGIQTRLVWDEDKLSDSSVAIATIYNDRKDLYSQIHTIAFTKERDGYVAHNAMNGSTESKSLKEAISVVSEDPKLICAIEILQ